MSGFHCCRCPQPRFRLVCATEDCDTVLPLTTAEIKAASIRAFGVVHGIVHPEELSRCWDASPSMTREFYHRIARAVLLAGGDGK